MNEEILLPREREVRDRCLSAVDDVTGRTPAYAILGYGPLARGSEARGEHSDCTVFSAAVALGLGYNEAHELLKYRFNRPEGRGAHFPAQGAAVFHVEGPGTNRFEPASRWTICLKNLDVQPGVSLATAPCRWFKTRRETRPGEWIGTGSAARFCQPMYEWVKPTWGAFAKKLAQPKNAGRYIVHIARHAFAVVVDEAGRVFCADGIVRHSPRTRVHAVFRVVPTPARPAELGRIPTTEVPVR